MLKKASGNQWVVWTIGGVAQLVLGIAGLMSISKPTHQDVSATTCPTLGCELGWTPERWCPGRTTWFLRKAAASPLEHLLVCRFVRSVVAYLFAVPRTPPLWQRDFFLVNCSVLRRLLASVRSGVVKTFRCTTLAFPHG